VSRLWCCALFAAPVSATAQLTLEQAERLALDSDPAVAAVRARAASLEEQAVADGQLPDPRLGLGMLNVPVDDFSLSREPMTQFQTRIEQAFPRGDTLRYRQAGKEWLSKSELAREQLVKREIQRDVRETFLELYYQQRALGIIDQSRELFRQMVEITRAHFASGRATQQDVLRAQLELSRLDDRATGIQEQADVQRAQLSRWLGDLAWEPLGPGYPVLPDAPDYQRLSAALPQHPAIESANAQLESRQQAVNAAREQYKPGWNVGVEYRKRFGDDPDGSDRADMMAATVSLDLPLFPEKRQDRQLSASQQEAEAARQDRDQRMRELRRTLDTDYRRWQRLGEQQTLYGDRLLQEAHENSQAALYGYQNGVGDFSSLVRARITELDLMLQDLRVRTNRSRAQARLLYLAPEGEKQ